MSRLYDPEPQIAVEVNDDGRPATVTWDRIKRMREVVNGYRVVNGSRQS